MLYEFIYVKFKNRHISMIAFRVTYLGGASTKNKKEAITMEIGRREGVVTEKRITRVSMEGN